MDNDDFLYGEAGTTAEAKPSAAAAAKPDSTDGDDLYNDLA